MAFTIRHVLESIQRYPWTMLAVDVKGNIKNCMGVVEIPASRVKFAMLTDSEANKECAITFHERNDNITEAELIKKIEVCMASLKFEYMHGLRPALN